MRFEAVIAWHVEAEGNVVTPITPSQRLDYYDSHPWWALKTPSGEFLIDGVTYSLNSVRMRLVEMTKATKNAPDQN